MRKIALAFLLTTQPTLAVCPMGDEQNDYIVYARQYICGENSFGGLYCNATGQVAYFANGYCFNMIEESHLEDTARKIDKAAVANKRMDFCNIGQNNCNRFGVCDNGFTRFNVRTVDERL